MKKIILAVFALMFGLMLAGCVAEDPDVVTPPGSMTPPPADTDEYTYGKALVTKVEVMTDPNDPPDFKVFGNLPDGCTELDEIQQTKTGTTFMITMTTKRPKDDICTQALRPFEKIITLEWDDTNAGSYTIDVNGVRKAFTLTEDQD